MMGYAVGRYCFMFALKPSAPYGRNNILMSRLGNFVSGDRIVRNISFQSTTSKNKRTYLSDL